MSGNETSTTALERVEHIAGELRRLAAEFVATPGLDGHDRGRGSDAILRAAADLAALETVQQLRRGVSV
jgi:hypothetical protein